MIELACGKQVCFTIHEILSVQFSEEIITEFTDDMTLLLGIGLEFGTVGFGGGIVEVKRAGCAKIVKVG